ncbi:MarR family winged helix-turn-helix transcriptional regulator [Cecembia rubra]|uniref:HTH-type transcriptional regulator SarZ n=1 Tax=Cecembia rubra TaxID=1485585 RepID=A0A2P8E1W9_9BACT|nr:MarR family transcriptional regulator [Cecembia rubra]PSL03455.1 DNA-binding MarR family transcriptional regulator [Cecembia rubra]
MANLEKEPGFPFYVVSRLISQAYREPLESLSLTYPQYLVMLCLWEEDGLMVSQIGERLSLDSGTLTPLLKRLEAMNLVKRERSEKDERKVGIQLTYPGKSLQSKASLISSSLDAVFANWAEKDKSKLEQLMNKLLESLKSHSQKF